LAVGISRVGAFSVNAKIRICIGKYLRLTNKTFGGGHMDKKDIMVNGEQGLDTDQTVQSDQQAKRKQVRFVEEGTKTQYAGVFNIGFGAGEVIFFFGNTSLDPNVVRIESKIAVSIKTAKQLAVMLSNMVRQYEAKNGAIDISAPKAAPERSPRLQ
jgi:hypothetical protein